MRELGHPTKGTEGLAESLRETGTDKVKPQDGPLNRPGTEAEDRAGKPGVDEGTTEGLSKSS